MSGSGYVYSTRFGELCPDCDRPKADCRCRKEQPGIPDDGVVRVARQSQGRKGKGVTTIHGVPLYGKELTALAKELKKKCGSGGSVKDGVIEIQGDHRDRLVPLLEKRGWTVKRAGG